MFRKMIGVFCAAVLLLCAGACANNTLPKISDTRFMLDTVVTLTAYTDDSSVINEAFDLCEHYEKIFSRTVENSDVWRINHSGGEKVTVNDDTAKLISLCLEYGDKSDGMFDISVAPVSSLWDFSSEEGSVPDADKIKQALAFVGYEQIILSDCDITVPNGVGIDLGAAAKGYIADRIAEVFRKKDIPAVINLGGNVLTVGHKPDGTDWKIGVRDPNGEENAELCTVSVGEKSLVTSGIYERYFMNDGVRYHHLLSTDDGYPVNNGIASVTVMTDSSVQGDILSTMLYLFGLDKGMEYVEANDGVEALFVTLDGEISCSSGFAFQKAAK